MFVGGIGYHGFVIDATTGECKSIIDIGSAAANENKSLDAEKIYDENVDNTYVKVRVKDGVMVIVGVYVNDVLIDTIDYVEK